MSPAVRLRWEIPAEVLDILLEGECAEFFEELATPRRWDTSPIKLPESIMYEEEWSDYAAVKQGHLCLVCTENNAAELNVRLFNADGAGFIGHMQETSVAETKYSNHKHLEAKLSKASLLMAFLISVRGGNDKNGLEPQVDAATQTPPIKKKQTRGGWKVQKDRKFKAENALIDSQRAAEQRLFDVVENATSSRA